MAEYGERGASGVVSVNRGEGRIGLRRVLPGKLSVDLVGGDLHEPWRTRGGQGRAEQRVRSRNVGSDEGCVVLDGAVHVGFGGQVQDGVYVTDKLAHEARVADVTVDEPVARILVHALQVVQIPGVREEIEVDHLHVRALLEEITDEVGADEARSTGDEQSHGSVDRRPGEGTSGRCRTGSSAVSATSRVARYRDRTVPASVQPVHDVVAQGSPLHVAVVHVGDLQLSTVRGRESLHDLEDAPIVEVAAGDREVTPRL